MPNEIALPTCLMTHHLPQEKESRRGSVAQGSGVRDSSSVHGDNAGHVLQNGARSDAGALSKEQYDDTGTESGAFRPYATDLSLQVPTPLPSVRPATLKEALMCTLLPAHACRSEALQSPSCSK